LLIEFEDRLAQQTSIAQLTRTQVFSDFMDRFGGKISGGRNATISSLVAAHCGAYKKKESTANNDQSSGNENLPLFHLTWLALSSHSLIRLHFALAHAENIHSPSPKLIISLLKTNPKVRLSTTLLLLVLRTKLCFCSLY